MIIYHQRNDVFHCIFRVLSIFAILDTKKIEADRLKIIDFYFTFPHMLKNITIPRSTGSIQLSKWAQTLSVPYENIPNNKIIFSEMGDFQLLALDILISKDILTYENEFLTIGSNFKNIDIQRLVEDNTYTSNRMFKSLVDIFISNNLYGPNGLKHRTGLMEYRYDAV